MIDQSTSQQKKKYVAYLLLGTVEKGTDLFCDFFLELTPAEFKSLGQLYAYNRDKNETYVVEGDGVQAVDGKYRFYREEGKTI